MQLANLLRESLDVDCDEVRENERTGHVSDEHPGPPKSSKYDPIWTTLRKPVCQHDQPGNVDESFPRFDQFSCCSEVRIHHEISPVISRAY